MSHTERVEAETDRQTNRPRDGKRGEERGRGRRTETERAKGGGEGVHTERERGETDRQTQRETERGERETHTGRQTDKETDRDRQTETQRETERGERETHTQADRQTKRQTETDRQRGSASRYVLRLISSPASITSAYRIINCKIVSSPDGSCWWRPTRNFQWHFSINISNGSISSRQAPMAT